MRSIGDGGGAWSEDGGGHANRNGQQHRQAVQAILLGQSWQAVEWPGKDRHESHLLNRFGVVLRDSLFPDVRAGKTPVFVPNVVVGQTFYDTPLVAHFLLWRPGWPEPITLFTRYQQSGGSTRERLYYLYDNLIERVPLRSLLLLAGDEFANPSVLNAARDQVERSNGKIAHVYLGLDAFRQYLTEGSPWHPFPHPRLAVGRRQSPCSPK